MALALIEPAIKRWPNHAGLANTRGLGLRAAGRLAEARIEFDRAIALTPNAYAFVQRAALREGDDPEGALTDLAAAIKLDPRTDNYRRRIVIEVRLTRLDDALADAAKMVELAPDVPGVRSMRGEVYARMKKADLAAADFAWVRTKVSSSADELNNLCWKEALLNVTPDLALKDCDASLVLAPDRPDVLDSRGLALIRLGRYTDAVAAYDAALAQRANNASSLYGRGLAKLKADVADGRDDLAAALRIDAKVETTYARMGLKPT
jgi:tetratricopeptide (TPR) repeat protein